MKYYAIYYPTDRKIIEVIKDDGPMAFEIDPELRCCEISPETRVGDLVGSVRVGELYAVPTSDYWMGYGNNPMPNVKIHSELTWHIQTPSGERTVITVHRTDNGEESTAILPYRFAETVLPGSGPLGPSAAIRRHLESDPGADGSAESDGDPGVGRA